MASLKTLSTDQMVAVSSRWIDPTKDRALLEKWDTVKPQIVKLEGVHHQLVAAKVGTGKADALVGLKGKEHTVDAVHDRKISGVVGLLEALAQLTDSAADHDRYLGLVARLVPDGLSITKASYLAEAGAAERSEGRLTRDDLTLMNAIALPGELKNLEVQYDAYLAAGRELGDLEAEKTRLEGTPDGTTKSEVISIRNTWIRTVSAILGNLENEAVPAEDLQALVGPLHKAQLLAAKGEGSGDEPATDGAAAVEPAKSTDPTQAKG